MSRGEDSSWRSRLAVCAGGTLCDDAPVPTSPHPGRDPTLHCNHGGWGTTRLRREAPRSGEWRGARRRGGARTAWWGSHAATRCPRPPACTSARLFMRGEGSVAAQRTAPYLHSKAVRVTRIVWLFTKVHRQFFFKPFLTAILQRRDGGAELARGSRQPPLTCYFYSRDGGREREESTRV